MINSKVFFQGLKSLKGSRSPAIPLAACFIALGALLKDAGFNIQQSAASSLFTYALPGQLVMAESLLVDEPSIGLEPKYINMVFEILEDLQKAEKKTIILVEQNAKKGLEFADIGYVLVSGQTAIAGKGDDLLKNPDVGRLFLGG